MDAKFFKPTKKKQRKLNFLEILLKSDILEFFNFVFLSIPLKYHFMLICFSELSFNILALFIAYHLIIVSPFHCRLASTRGMSRGKSQEGKVVFAKSDVFALWQGNCRLRLYIVVSAYTLLH